MGEIMGLRSLCLWKVTLGIAKALFTVLLTSVDSYGFWLLVPAYVSSFPLLYFFSTLKMGQ
jgi:hypothetical protein